MTFSDSFSKPIYNRIDITIQNHIIKIYNSLKKKLPDFSLGKSQSEISIRLSCQTTLFVIIVGFLTLSVKMKANNSK